MKAPNIRYLRACSLQEASTILAEHGGEAVPLAGGQSLLAALNLRLSSPRLVVDINALPELAVSNIAADEIRLGALTRHVEILDSSELKCRIPLLPRAAAFIGHAAIRNRGTLGGSLAFADPAAELPACAVALDATIVIGGVQGERHVRAEDFFTGLMETALRPGELVLGVRFPTAKPATRYAFAELARRHGDFAVAGIAIAAEVDRESITTARVVYFGCVDRVQVAKHVSSALTGCDVRGLDIERAVEAVASDLAPDGMPGWRADTKLRLAQTLTRRAVRHLVGITE